MEKKALLLCSVVSFLILLVVATGFAAEATRVKFGTGTRPKGWTRETTDDSLPSQVNIVGSSTWCNYPRSPAMVLGLTAALSLLLGQMMINVSTGCICCLRGPRPTASKWRTAVICFIVSWFLDVIAFLLLLAGAALNDRRNEQHYYFGYYECYVLKPGVFAVATILAVASLVLGLVYFLILNSAKNDPTVWGNPSIPPQANIAMGQPQFPPPPPQGTANPAFVREDTYMRRQFT